MIFGAKKIEVNRVEDNSRQDLALITQMNQELAGSLDLKETCLLYTSPSPRD